LKAEILTIGDELLRGEIVDTNKSFLSERLLRFDVETRFQSSVCDDPDDMADAFRRAAGRADVVLVSGGLGPTRDDITFEVLARTFGRGLVRHEPSLAAIRAFFARLGREMSPSNEKQALLPEGAEVLPNPVGTAPGCMLEAGGAVFFCLPGVPRELARMLDEEVLPRLATRLRPTAGGVMRATGGVMRSTLLRTFGMGESTLEDELLDLAREEGVSLGFRTAFPDNDLRPVVRAATEAEAGARLARVVEAIEKRLGPLIYGRDDETLEQALGKGLVARGLTLAVAESCTGGLLAERISAVPGASRYFRGGVVAYANDAKRELLGVPEALLAAHGAVSAPVARAMAEGARRRFGADLAVSTTGISGPDGGTAEKPVGLVFVGFADSKGGEAHEFLFPFDRARHRLVTTQVALDWVRRALLGEARVAPRWLRGSA
jgi:nicotinamide-nucleotide amidase